MPSEGDYLRRVPAGETLESIPRDAYNAFVEAALAFRGRGRGGAGTPTFSRDTTLVTVRNSSGADVDRFGVLELTEALITPDDGEEEFDRTVMLEGVTPTGTSVPFCVLLEPLPEDAIGRAVVAGVVPCRVTGTAGATAAGPQEGSAAALLAGAPGAQVLWQESGSGERRAYVLLGVVGGPRVRCRKVLTDVYCLSGQLYYTAEYDHINAADQILYTNSSACGVSLTVAGVTNGTCTACAALNASFNLLQTSLTTWAYSGGLVACSGEVVSMALTLSGATLTLLVKSASTTIATYTNSAATGYDGTSAVVVTKVSNSGACATWPSTLTVNPV